VLDTIEDGLISCIIVRYNFLNDIITPEILWLVIVGDWSTSAWCWTYPSRVVW
jgi:hypothetical protein